VLNTIRLKSAAASVICVLGVLAIAGCGSSNSTTTTGTAPAKPTTPTTPTTPATPAAAAGTSKVALSAAASGALMYSTTSLSAKAGSVTIDFTNTSSTPHNVTVANSAGKVLGATPTFSGGTKTLTLMLAKGTYTYYCSVPGHEQAGMKGTLAVS
jgi:plastocyanin